MVINNVITNCTNYCVVVEQTVTIVSYLTRLVQLHMVQTIKLMSPVHYHRCNYHLYYYQQS